MKICALRIPLAESLRGGLSCSFSLAGPGQIALGISNAQTSENSALSEFVHGELVKRKIPRAASEIGGSEDPRSLAESALVQTILS